MLRCWLVVGLLVGVTSIVGAEDSGASAPLVEQVRPGFHLTGPDGKDFELKAQANGPVTIVCFLGTECPLARLYGPRLSELAREYANRPVRFIGINSNSQDSPKDVAEFVKELGITFPIYKDPANKVADQFGARRMAEVFVVDQSLTIKYRGRVDDQYQPGLTRGQATRQDLRVALEELLAGKPVSVARTETTGCLIGRIKTPATNPEVTFCNQVIRVLNKHCVECHRPGEIGPFSLTDYDEVTGWGETILETVNAGRMPPWNASSEHGKFRNARVMADADKQILRDWFAAGMPRGDDKQLPPQQTWRTGWQLPHEPDLVVKMRERPFKVAASGTVEYQYFVFDPKFTEDKWVSAAQVIPGVAGVVHHCIVFVRPPDGSAFRGVGWLTGYVPGQRSFALPPGYARRVPAGSKFVFQMHYTPNGVEQQDITQMGINFVPEGEVTNEVYTLLGIDQEFEIPPHHANFPVHGTSERFSPHAELLAIVPHMHVRGKSFQATSKQGDKTTLLLDVPRYDFNWQHVYELDQPLPLSEIDSLEFTAWFDNSKHNPVNPDPTQTVTWGDQTWEEMAIAFFEVAESRQATASEPAPQPRLRGRNPKRDAKPEKTVDAEAFVKEFFGRFDKNGDGIIEKTELPLGLRQFGLHRYDDNQDQKLSKDEVESAARRER